MNVKIIIQARMSSTRLPGKVLKKVKNKPLLQIQLERLKMVKNADGLIVATTVNESDDSIVELCSGLSIPIFRGSEEDVLERYYLAARRYNADVIVRITSDCPVIDPRVVEKVMAYYVSNKDKIDYVSNTLTRSYPRGMDTEVFSFTALEQAHYKAVDASEREHVTMHIYRNPKTFRLANVAYYQDASHHRWTVDTAEDFELIEQIIQYLYPKDKLFTLEDMLAAIEEHPDWYYINNKILQKNNDF